MKTSIESFIMNGKSIAGLSLASFLSLILLGCGGGEEAVAPADVNTTVAAEPEIKGKKSSGVRSASSGSAQSNASAYDRIDSALDSGNFMGAVNVAIKSGGNATENMEYVRYVQTQLGDSIARGDAKAIEAYNKLNAFYMMKYQR